MQYAHPLARMHRLYSSISSDEIASALDRISFSERFASAFRASSFFAAISALLSFLKNDQFCATADCVNISKITAAQIDLTVFP